MIVRFYLIQLNTVLLMNNSHEFRESGGKIFSASALSAHNILHVCSERKSSCGLKCNL